MWSFVEISDTDLGIRQHAYYITWYDMDWLGLQDMEKGGALENMSTAETVKILVDAYLCSDAAYNATVNIQSLSKNVSRPSYFLTSCVLQCNKQSVD